MREPYGRDYYRVGFVPRGDTRGGEVVHGNRMVQLRPSAWSRGHRWVRRSFPPVKYPELQESQSEEIKEGQRIARKWPKRAGGEVRAWGEGGNGRLADSPLRQHV